MRNAPHRFRLRDDIWRDDIWWYEHGQGMFIYFESARGGIGFVRIPWRTIRNAIKRLEQKEP